MMVDLLTQTLSPLGYPVLLQGSIAPGRKYPEHFFTFWNNGTEGAAHYSNRSHETLWDYDLNFYSVNPASVNTTLTEAAALLRQNGFIVSGKGHDVGSDEPTHTGRGIHIQYSERT